MNQLARRMLFAFSTLSLGLGAACPGTAAAQTAPVTYSASGQMLFAMHTQFAAALRAQGFTYSLIGYTPQSNSTQGGFTILGGSINSTTAYGEILCGGDLQYVKGALTMDLRNLQFESTPIGEFLTAAVFLNGVSQGRQTVFTSPYNELWGLTWGRTVTPNSYMSFDPAFQQLFLSFFAVPQLATAFSDSSIGFFSFTLDAEPM